MTNYLIDSNSFIEPYRRYYSFDIVPSYWIKFLSHYDHSIFLIDKVKLELCHQTEVSKKDSLQIWIENNCVEPHKVIRTMQDQEIVNAYSERA